MFPRSSSRPPGVARSSPAATSTRLASMRKLTTHIQHARADEQPFDAHEVGDRPKQKHRERRHAGHHSITPKTRPR